MAEFRERFANPYVAAERGYIDAVIRPSETRRRLNSALDMLAAKREKNPAEETRQYPALICIAARCVYISRRCQPKLSLLRTPSTTMGRADRTDCDGWYLVRARAEHHRGADAAGHSETRHHHRTARGSSSSCSAGELTMEMEHHEFVLRPGEGIEIAPGQQHQAMNRSTGGPAHPGHQPAAEPWRPIRRLGLKRQATWLCRS